MCGIITRVLLLVTAAAACYFRVGNGLPTGADGNTRIVGGREVAQGETPHQLSLQVWGGRNFIHFCGASLASVDGIQLAVSAAHCFRNVNHLPIVIIAGAIDLHNSTGAEQVRRVTQIVAHPKFDNDNTWMSHDIALLFLSAPFSLNDNVSVIPLPSSDMKDVEGGELIVTGWGRLYQGGPSPNRLQLVQIPVIDDIQCQSAWNSGEQLVLDSMVCAGTPEGDQSPCNGDSGGPAVSYGGNFLAGIVSFGYACGHPEYPAVFTEVAYFLDWIEEQVAIQRA